MMSFSLPSAPLICFSHFAGLRACRKLPPPPPPAEPMLALPPRISKWRWGPVE